jgi:hypothetical protein
MDSTMVAAQKPLNGSGITHMSHALGTTGPYIAWSGWGTPMLRLELLVPLIVTQALYRFRNVSRSLHVIHFGAPPCLPLHGTQRLWGWLPELGVAITSDRLRTDMGGAATKS